MKSKKLFYGMSLGCAALLLCGCGSTTTEEKSVEEAKTQTIKCTYNTESGDLAYTIGYNFVYNETDKVISSAAYYTQFTYDEADEETYGSLNYCDNYKDDEGVFTDCSSTNDNRTVTTTIGINLDNLIAATTADETEDAFKKTFTPEEVKSWVETYESGFTCTIE